LDKKRLLSLARENQEKRDQAAFAEYFGVDAVSDTPGKQRARKDAESAPGVGCGQERLVNAKNAAIQRRAIR
jgi:hypothetical protein